MLALAGLVCINNYRRMTLAIVPWSERNFWSCEILSLGVLQERKNLSECGAG